MANHKHEDAAPSDLDAKFWKFHQDNPAVFRHLVDLTQQARARGRSRISIGMLFEVIRWNKVLETTDPHFKLNNSYRSRYARILVERHPEFDGMFETRTIRS